MNLSSERYYNESGKANYTSIAMVVIIVLVVMLGVGRVYGFLSYYYPFVVLNLCITIGYVTLVGYSFSLSIKLLKIRNQKYMSRLSLILGMVAIYVAWMWFISVGYGSFVWSPIQMFNIVNQQELWWGVYVFWGIKAALILFGMWLSVKGEIVDPFCESCNKWINKTVIKNIEPIDVFDLIQEMENHRYNSLMSLQKVSDKAHNQTRIILYHCNGCGKKNYLTIEKVVVVIKKNGKPTEETSKKIVANLIVREKDMEQLLEWKNNI